MFVQKTIPEKVEEFFATTSLEEFKDYFYTHRDDDVREHYGLTFGVYGYIKKKYGLKLSMDQLNELRKESWANRMQDKHDEWTSKISKDDIYDYYITQNHCLDDCLKYFDISYTEFNWLMHHYGIVKDPALNNVHSRATKLDVYGDANYNNRDKARKTCLETYGVDNVFKDTEKMKAAYQEKLGVDHPMQIDSVKQKMVSHTDYSARTAKTKQTNLQRYGVEYANKLPEVKKRTSESLQKTFMDKYGCSCYWTSTDRKSSYNSKVSKDNEYFNSLLENVNITFQREFALLRKVFDFKVGKNLIEVNPYPTHNSTWGIFSDGPKDKYYHRDKSQLAEENGYRCIHVWDWDDKDKIVKLLLPRERVFARKCDVREVDLNTTREYLNKHHLQGYAKDTIRIGLCYNGELVSIMTFGKPRYNRKCDYELIRYCSSYNVVGGAEKLFSHFIKEYGPSSVVSYCDRSKFTGNTYMRLGFKFISNAVSKHWYNPKTDMHITDNLLRQRGFDQLFGTDFGKGTSNEDLMLKAGFVEIFDAGQSTYIWNKGA